METEKELSDKEKWQKNKKETKKKNVKSYKHNKKVEGTARSGSSLEFLGIIFSFMWTHLGSRLVIIVFNSKLSFFQKLHHLLIKSFKRILCLTFTKNTSTVIKVENTFDGQ